MPINIVRKKKADWDVDEKFADDDIAKAIALVEQTAQYFYPATPNLIPAFWPVPPVVPSIQQLDFGHAVKSAVALEHLKASQNWMRVDALIWHLNHPAKPAHDNPYTSMPLVLVTGDGPVIVDGHHRLGALLLLGVDEVPVWSLPAPGQPKE